MIISNFLSYSGLTKLRALSKCLFNNGRPDSLSCWDPSTRQFLPQESTAPCCLHISKLANGAFNSFMGALTNVLKSTLLELSPGGQSWSGCRPLHCSSFSHALQPAPHPMNTLITHSSNFFKTKLWRAEPWSSLKSRKITCTTFLSSIRQVTLVLKIIKLQQFHDYEAHPLD